VLIVFNDNDPAMMGPAGPTGSVAAVSKALQAQGAAMCQWTVDFETTTNFGLLVSSCTNDFQAFSPGRVGGGGNVFQLNGAKTGVGAVAGIAILTSKSITRRFRRECSYLRALDNNNGSLYVDGIAAHFTALASVHGGVNYWRVLDRNENRLDYWYSAVGANMPGGIGLNLASPCKLDGVNSTTAGNRTP
jgi:hypothetical protein